MIDIYDIKTFLFWFIYNFDYLFFIWIFIFFICFYLFLNLFFNINQNKHFLKTNNITNNELKIIFNYLIENIEKFDREMFYKEVLLFLKMLINKKFNNDKIYFMTLKEIEKTFKSPYNEILRDVYFLEFNNKTNDSFEIRQNILKKINF